MRILALVPCTSVERLRLALTVPTDLFATTVSDAFLRSRALSDWDFLVVDPDLVRRHDTGEFVAELTVCSQPILVYTALARASAAVIAALSMESSLVVVKDYDDDVAGLRRILKQDPRSMLGPAMIRRIAQELDLLPGSLRRGTLVAFCAREPVRSVKQLAAITFLTRRSVDRWFRNVGLGQGKLVLSVSQLLRAYSVAEAEGGSLNSVAVASGYGSAKALQHNSVHLTGKTFAIAHDLLNPKTLLDVLEGALRGTNPDWRIFPARLPGAQRQLSIQARKAV